MRLNAILILNASKLASWHFFVFARHAGVFRFNPGRGGPERPPLLAQYSRFYYEATPFLEAGKHKQLVELRNARFEFQLEASAIARPHSRNGSLSWRWKCPECGQTVSEVRMRVSDEFFGCDHCQGCRSGWRSGNALNGSFLVLPPKLSANVVPFPRDRRSEAFV